MDNLIDAVFKSLFFIWVVAVFALQILVVLIISSKSGLKKSPSILKMDELKEFAEGEGYSRLAKYVAMYQQLLGLLISCFFVVLAIIVLAAIVIVAMKS